jgi:hypothetical protein
VSVYAHQLRAVCAWNRQLARENIRLRERIAHLARVNARQSAEAEASESLLTAAMDEAVRARRT